LHHDRQRLRPDAPLGQKHRADQDEDEEGDEIGHLVNNAVSRVLAGIVVRLVPDILVRKHTFYKKGQSDRREQEKKHPDMAVALRHQMDGQPIQPEEQCGHVEIAGEKARGCHAHLHCKDSSS
jgi:hypothetical protein